MEAIKIKVQIFGVKNELLTGGCGCGNKQSGCSSKENSCDGCSSKNESCGGCKSSSGRTLEDAYNELKTFINESDVKDQTIIEFVDLNEIKLEDEFERIRNTIDKGFEPPITVVDDIIRYYGGISNRLIYNDIKELLE
ncbi:hypothetical protein [Clostridium thailandense]|uniref:hypothetical protein n=1 Tax=Clostridium thailandense TaxID=2794346 RepID=UPI003989043B